MLRITLIAGALGLAASAAGAGPTNGVPAPGIEQDTAGKAIFTGKGNCFTCHGQDAKGTVLAPDLTDDVWLNADGTLESVIEVIAEGVTAPKEHPAPMPAKGGANLTDAEVRAVAAYVLSLAPKGEGAPSR